ncbi:MAG: threonine/serine exporter family protein [Xylanivirga thermophila]|uniref:threonine/serine exporter family protein n=1 Tax=Xylanivirga thermophila TaxID=2496273 RepID=UPI00101C4798|nr:threonine/serine exporter family protein [Xylanivirga thermophila]
MILQIIYGFFATIGFGILFNVPKKYIIEAGFSGAIGWAGYLLMMHISKSTIAATFIASIFIGIMGEFFAKRTKNPVTIFIIPAIIPLVPGVASYKTIKALIDGKNKEALSLGILTAGIALAISSGLILVISFFRIRSQKQSWK